MMKWVWIFSVIFVAACSGGEKTPKISRADIAEPQGLTYEQFKSRTSDEGSLAAQKRFLLLDKDNNGRISEAEMGGR